RIVARAQGLEGRVEALPGRLPPRPDDARAVIVHLGPGEVVPANLRLLERRRTYRGPFEAFPPSEVLLAELPALAQDLPLTRLDLVTGKPARLLGAVIVDATRELVRHAPMVRGRAALVPAPAARRGAPPGAPPPRPPRPPSPPAPSGPGIPPPPPQAAPPVADRYREGARGHRLGLRGHLRGGSLRSS